MCIALFLFNSLVLVRFSFGWFFCNKNDAVSFVVDLDRMDLPFFSTVSVVVVTAVEVDAVAVAVVEEVVAVAVAAVLAFGVGKVIAQGSMIDRQQHSMSLTRSRQQ